MGTLRALVGIGVGLIAVGAWAASELKAPDFTLTPAKAGRAYELRAVPPGRHHINIEAPMGLKTEGSNRVTHPVRSAEKEAVFQPSLKEGEDFEVSLYLCDDAKTFCEKHSLRASWSPRAGIPLATTQVSGRVGADVAEGAASPVKAGEFGFILNDPERAFAEARREGKPLLIDFFGIWCPPCNQFDEQVFGTPEFKAEAAHFVLLKLDADSPVSWAYKERYRVSGYPTILFASPQGEEITRVLGFRERPEFVKYMKSAFESRGLTESVWRKKADAGDPAARDRIGTIEFDRGDYASAARDLKDSKKLREKYLESRIGELEKSSPPAPAERIMAAIEEANQEFPNTPEAILRYDHLADLQEEAKHDPKATLTQAVAAAEKLSREPERLGSNDLTTSDVLEALAGFRERLGDEAGARKSWAAAAADLRKQLRREDERGINLERAFCLWKAGDVPAAEKIYSGLERKFPKEFTFYYAHANMKFKLKHPEQAEPLAAKAYEYSYGDNRLRVGALRAKILRDLGRKREALDVIHDTLSTVKLTDDAALRTRKYAEALKDLEKQLRG